MSANCHHQEASPCWRDGLVAMPDSQPTNNGLEKIRAVAFDLDGVLTDGSFWWSEDGAELKRFCFADVMGVSVARASRHPSSLSSPGRIVLSSIVMPRSYTFSMWSKVAATRRSHCGNSQRPSTSISQKFCFMGDDINDLPCNADRRLLRCSCQRFSPCSLLRKLCSDFEWR